jgi:hypothetical protein
MKHWFFPFSELVMKIGQISHLFKKTFCGSNASEVNGSDRGHNYAYIRYTLRGRSSRTTTLTWKNQGLDRASGRAKVFRTKVEEPGSRLRQLKIQGLSHQSGRIRVSTAPAEDPRSFAPKRKNQGLDHASGRTKVFRTKAEESAD